MKPMNTFLLFAGILLIAIALFVPSISDSSDSSPPKLGKWTIVCNDAGKWSYTKWDGELVWDEFATREAAEKSMIEKRTWSDAYDFQRSEENIRRRAAEFKPR